MKKFISIALAAVMTTSVADVSVQAADFTDEGSNIKYGEAVDVVSALNIMDKSSDGTFAPEDMLTRGEAAKIICNMMSGNIDAYTGNTEFSDVPADNIYAPYIEYCAANGIVSGYGDGTFHPDGFVTGDEFLKMLLVALGYDGAEEGISGSSWAAQVELLANDLGLTKGNDDFVGSDKLTCQEACLYALNTLKANMVTYDGSAVAVTSAENSNSIYDETNDEASSETPDVVQFAEKFFPELTLCGDAVYTWTYTVNGTTQKIGTYVDEEKYSIDRTGDVFFYNHAAPVASGVIDGVSVNYYDAIINGVPTVAAVEAGGSFDGTSPTTGLYLNYTTDDSGKYIVDKGEWVNGNDLNAPEEGTDYYTTETDGFSGVTVSNNTMTVLLDHEETYTLAADFKAFEMVPNAEETAVVATEVSLSSDITGAERTRAIVVTNDNGEASELYLYGLDNEEIMSLLDETIELAGDDPSLQLAQGLQCKTADVPNVRLAPNYEEHTEPTKLFDNLYFVGGTEAGVFIFEDEDGYIMIDSGYSYMPVGDDTVDGYIIPGMEELGLDPAKIKVILITHSGPDHTGGAAYFQENYGTKVIYSIEDAEELQAEIENGADFGFTVNVEEDTTYTGDNADAYGKIFTVSCGDNTVLAVSCPRTQPRNGEYSGLSYIAKVTYTQQGEEPVEHIWATYGNTNVTGGVEDMELYHSSVTNFMKIAQDSSLLQSKLGTSEGKIVDVVISNHPFVDMSVPMMEQMRQYTDEEGNFLLADEDHPFVWGAEKVETFFTLLDTCREVIYTRAINNIDATGTSYMQ